jgi:protein-disulfide isomerase
MPANNPRMTKAERREAARREAARLAAKQKAVEQRNRLIIIIASVLVVALVGVAGFFIYQASKQTLLTEFEGARPAGSTDTGGITFGSSLEAGTVNEGASEVDLYVDFMCPFCGQFDAVNRGDIRTMAADGDATVTIHPVSNLDAQSNGTMFSTRSANAFATVAVEAPDTALDFMEAMFDNQPQEGTEGLSDDEIAQIAVEAGVPQEVADELAAGTYTEWVEVATNQAHADGATGTPAIFIDGSRWSGDWNVAGALYTEVTGEAPPTGEPSETASDDASTEPGDTASDDASTEPGEEGSETGTDG